MSDDFQRGLQARLAHLIGEASQWSRGSGAHPPGLVKVLNEALEYGCAEIERLRDLIRTHNASCENACAARSDAHCEPWLTRGRWCPDCPREWMIEGEGQKS
jgi:hypothetical protein